MKHYLLVRHGLATLSKHGYTKENVLLAPLLQEGLANVNKVAAFLKTQPTEINLNSPVLRCQQTADIISLQTGKKFIADSRLSEFDAINLSISTGENFAGFIGRIRNLLDELEDRAEQNILLVTHGAVCACISHLLTTGKFAVEDEIDYPDPAGYLEILDNKVIERVDRW